MAKEKKNEIIEFKVNVLPDFKNMVDIERIYTNYVAVSHDNLSFVITFCDNRFETIKPQDLGEKDEEGNLIVMAPVIAQVIVSPKLMPEIIKAFQINYDKYLKREKAEKKSE